jgi:PAS domain S-box-containing protein
MQRDAQPSLDLDRFREVQEQLRRQAALIDLSRDAIIIRDARGNVVSWNRGAAEVYGWTAEEAIGKNLAVLLHTDPSVWAALNAQLVRESAWEGELHQRRRDGTPVVVQCREVVARDENGEIDAVLAIKRDVTERLRVLEALKLADRRKDEFLATLAHELRNPLGPIRNAIEIMRLSGDDPQAIVRVRGMLERQVRQLARIVDDLVDVARIVERKVELHRERVALRTIVETAVETCRSLIEGCQHELSVNMPSEPLELDGDPVRLAQVLINLLNNAARYTPPGGRIWLTIEHTPHGGADRDEITVRVRDSGIGIRPEVLPHVFDMFTQGDALPQQGKVGLGIGLTLVQSLVDMHDGSVEVHSEGPGRGSEFVVRLPVASAISDQARRSPPRKGDVVRRRVLVVDDNADQLESLGLLFELMGHEVQMASSGPAALETANAFHPDIALIDIGLPGMNGYEVARRIRERPELRDVVLVAQTGWGQDDDQRRSWDAGFDHHLVKPVKRDTLERLVNELPRAQAPSHIDSRS